MPVSERLPCGKFLFVTVISNVFMIEHIINPACFLQGENNRAKIR